MTDETTNLVLEHLRALRHDLAECRAEIREMRTDLSLQINSLGQQVGALSTAVYGGHGEMDQLRARIERIERRLELADS